MGVSGEHIKHIMLYEFNQRHTATVMTPNINTINGQSTLNINCQGWFQKFQFGNRTITNNPTNLDGL